MFTGYNHWWLIPPTACHVGGLLGALLYCLLLRTEDQQGAAVGSTGEDCEDFMKKAGLAELSTANYLPPSQLYTQIYPEVRAKPSSTATDAQCQTQAVAEEPRQL